jgi:hypothetical protein
MRAGWAVKAGARAKGEKRPARMTAAGRSQSYDVGRPWLAALPVPGRVGQCGLRHTGTQDVK